MTVDEAKELLPQYADGVLDGEPARELEGLLAKTPHLQDELKALKEENLLLEEALAPLRPSNSARMRLTDAIVDVHRRASTMAESLPARGSRIFRLLFSFLALGGAVILAQYRPPENLYVATGGAFLLMIVLMLFFVGLTFVLLGSALARTEARLISMLTQQPPRPSALGVLTVQVFGVLAILTAFAMYLWMI